MLRLDFASFKYPPSPKVIRLLQERAAAVNEYPDETYAKIKAKIAALWGIEQEKILLGNGLDELIDLITRTFVKEGEEVIVPVPTFSQFAIAAQRASATVTPVNSMKSEGYAVNSEDMLSAVTERTRLVWVCTPNNPTGTTVPASTIKQIARSVAIPIVVDNALGDFSAEPVTSLVKEQNIILLRTFSKGYCLAGLRIGYAIASQNLIKRIEKIKQIFNVNSLAVEAACAALASRDYYTALWEKIIAERQRVCEAVSTLGVRVAGSQSNFILLDFTTEKLSRLVFNGLLRAGIKVFPGWDKEFSGLDGRYLRVVVGKPEENGQFLQALEAQILNNPQ